MVRIVEDFWENYKTNSTTITKSVLHILRQKFMIRDGENEREVFNTVIIEMHRLQIFQKWNQSRLTSEKLTTEKQFEQYLYQRIWSIIDNIYAKRRRDKSRYRIIDFVENLHPSTWVAPPELYADNIDLNSILDQDQKDKERDIQHVRAVRHPTIFERGDIVYIPEDASEELEANDAYIKIKRLCKNEKEQKIVQYRLDGLSPQQISEILNITITTVYSVIKRIKNRLAAKEVLEYQR